MFTDVFNRWIGMIFSIPLQWSHLRVMASQVRLTRRFVQQLVDVSLTRRKQLRFFITVPLRGESTSDWWLPLTKGQQCGKLFHVMTSPRLSIRQSGRPPAYSCLCIYDILHISLSGWCNGFENLDEYAKQFRLQHLQHLTTFAQNYDVVIW